MDELMTFIIGDGHLWKTWRLSSWWMSATGCWRYPLLLESDSGWLGGSCCSRRPPGDLKFYLLRWRAPVDMNDLGTILLLMGASDRLMMLVELLMLATSSWLCFVEQLMIVFRRHSPTIKIIYIMLLPFFSHLTLLRLLFIFGHKPQIYRVFVLRIWHQLGATSLLRRFI